MGYGPEPLPSYRELRNLSYTIKFKLHFALGHYSSRTISCSHHLIIQLDPGIRSVPVQISFIDWQYTYAVMVAYHLWMYSLIVHRPAASITSSIRAYPHYLSSARPAVITEIWQAALWWNPYNIITISNVTTQLALPYIITICATALYIIPRARTILNMYTVSYETNLRSFTILNLGA